MPTKTRILFLSFLVSLVIAPFSASSYEVNDANVTETLERWGTRLAPDFSISKDSKVGNASLCGTLGSTRYVTLAPEKGRSWNLTEFGKIRFWAKANAPTSNVLVMLIGNGFDNRRDGVAAIGTNWTQYELPLNETGFAKLKGQFDFRDVKALVFYNNGKADVQLWLDGLEFAEPREKQLLEASELKPATGADGATWTVRTEDPAPHLEEAATQRHAVQPTYDLPPVAFNPANAFKDALVNFDQATDWTAIARDVKGFMCLSKDQPLNSARNLKIEVTEAGANPMISLVPPKPLNVAKDFDIVECWIYGFMRGGKVAFHFRRDDGSLLVVGGKEGENIEKAGFQPVQPFWNLLRVVLRDKVPAGANLIAVHIAPNWTEDYKRGYPMHLAQLRVRSLSEQLQAPAPEFRNVGPKVDNLPTDPRGACPRTVEPVKSEVETALKGYRFAYTGGDGQTCVYLYTPSRGTFDDIAILPTADASFQPASGSGPVLDFNGKQLRPAKGEGKAELLSQEVREGLLRVAWRYSEGEASQTITYELGLQGKTLRIAAHSDERSVAAWDFGEAKGVPDARVIEVPFMDYSPNILLTSGMFVTYYTDWYFGNFTTLPTKSESYVRDGSAGYSWSARGGYSYMKNTAGLRQPFNEVFYITASRDVNDVMPTISNPPSPMKEQLKTRLYHMVSASSPGVIGRGRKFFDQCEQYGVTDYYFLYHAPLFMKRRAGCEPYPGEMNISMLHEPEGGDAAVISLFRDMRDKGVHPGYYDGFSSRDVTGPSFHYDWTAMDSSGQWMRRWRAPALKAWAFPELASTLYRERAKKFGARVSYQDGITAWIITTTLDMDHRRTEACLLRDTLKAVATGWQRCRENVDGPVFSEGRGSDFYTAGLNDGDYAKLKGYWDDKRCNEDRVPLLVDFRLRKLGELSAPVGLNCGYAGFSGTNKISFDSYYANPNSYDYFHHYLAAEIAFAAIGMLEPYWPLWEDPTLNFDKTLTSFYAVRALQQRYIMEPVAEISYFDGKRMLGTSDALRADVVKNNHVFIRYRNGLTLYVNMNWDGMNWRVEKEGRTYDLPAGGWLALQGKDFIAYSATVDGNRVDYVDSPEYMYLDGHGKMVEVNGRKTDRQLIEWRRGPKAGQVLIYPKP